MYIEETLMAENETNDGQAVDKEEGRKGKKESSGTVKGLAVVLIIIAFAVVAYQVYMGFFYLPFDAAMVRHDGDTLYIVAIGDVGPDAIEVVRANIKREFPEFGGIKTINMHLPEDAIVDLGPNTRPPYSADALLDAMAGITDQMPDLFKAMGVVEEPLYMEDEGPERDIWGLTNAIGANFGVVSTTLKRHELEQEGHKPGTENYLYYFDLSLGKSTLHEFGHLMGLNHCNGEVGCPMEISSLTSILEKHGNVYCDKHRAQLEQLYATWGIQVSE
jgi:predicted Zn-dependent protease